MTFIVPRFAQLYEELNVSPADLDDAHHPFSMARQEAGGRLVVVAVSGRALAVRDYSGIRLARVWHGTG